MPLNIHAMTTTDQPESLIDFEFEDATEFYYWRKHSQLLRWLTDVYHSKGGAGEFLDTSLQIEPTDLDHLEKLLNHNQLPMVEIVFEDAMPEAARQYDLVFVYEARARIRRGETVFIISSWQAIGSSFAA